MTLNTTQRAARAGSTNVLPTGTNKTDFSTGEAMGQAPDAKAIATQIARLALAGHAVYQIADGGFLVSKYSYTHHAKDFAVLQEFARKFGVNQ